jgi:hypothetical protein
MHPKEAALKERRTTLAIKNNYMGNTGKLGTIARCLGKPIIRQGCSLYNDNYLEDPYEIHEEKQLPEMDDESTTLEGYVFDSLSSGIPIEIIYFRQYNKLVVSYKGYKVYEEIAGDVCCFAPFAEWENWIDKFYDRAKKVFKNQVELHKEEDQAKIEKTHTDLLTKLRLLWGI